MPVPALAGVDATKRVVSSEYLFACGNYFREKSLSSAKYLAPLILLRVVQEETDQSLLLLSLISLIPIDGHNPAGRTLADLTMCRACNRSGLLSFACLSGTLVTAGQQLLYEQGAVK